MCRLYKDIYDIPGNRPKLGPLHDGPVNFDWDLSTVPVFLEKSNTMNKAIEDSNR